jgi:hypothetical protein
MDVKYVLVCIVAVLAIFALLHYLGWVVVSFG